MRLWALLILLPLAGCGIPPLVSVMAYVFDGGMLLATGKTTTDHGLSMVTGDDCQLWRVVNGNQVCENAVSLAQAENAAEIPILASGFAADRLDIAAPTLVLTPRLPPN